MSDMYKVPSEDDRHAIRLQVIAELERKVAELRELLMQAEGLLSSTLFWKETDEHHVWKADAANLLARIEETLD